MTEKEASAQKIYKLSSEARPAYCVIANGGLLLEPRLYKGVVDENGQYREWAASSPIRRVISQRTVMLMVETGGKTTVTTTVRYVSQQVRDAVLASGMSRGVAESYDVLAEVLNSIAREA